ncbi:DUF6334 family protein [Lysobacter yangpyeongensis]|uniref:DUF6334 family protein n=1 Tax=Lysobacter yangpyeongensis TaxID=346182 RepID=A0ABW0SRS3_9GAMM
MFTALKTACDRGGPLVGVRVAPLVPGSTLIGAFELRFKELTVTLSVADDDEISVTSAPLLQPTPAHASAPFAWSRCIGKRLRWAWLLTNQQGYTDGVRLEFGDPDVSESVVVELVVAASSLHPFISQPAEG